ncbi:MAG: glycogen-binding domain-containing protein [Deltaproteobacteria bacterium]|nr:glycogen-binding domain-containing protein [Deltaproteobacteria bacterium]
MSELISLFIDDEMSLDEKIHFVKQVGESRPFASDAIELLQMEKRVRSDVVERIPRLEPVEQGFFTNVFGIFRQPLGWVSAALAASFIALMMVIINPATSDLLTKKRFVIYLPGVNQVEIAGSFSDWDRIPMQRTGDSGYWEVHLDLPAGEHQFTYIVDHRERLADPTIRTREKDGFGGYNSILYVGDKA